MQAERVNRPSLLKELIALLVFLVVCGNLALPLLTPGGEVAARIKTAFVFSVFCRLAWQMYKRSFRFSDYLIYFALTAGLCIWLDLSL